MSVVEVGRTRPAAKGITRRRFIGYLIAAPTLVAAADLRAAPVASASVPTVQPVDVYDLTDLLTDAADLTAALITVTINPDGSCTVSDDGRGIPVDIHPKVGKPTLEVVLTTVGAGAKFDKRTYKTSAGLHGMGAKAVTALTLGKNYTQDQALRWGFLTRPEETKHEP